MKIKLTLPENAAEYVRHARSETLRAIGQPIEAKLLEPAPYATYLLAYGADEGRPVGMVEFAFLSQICGSFDDIPSAQQIGTDRLGSFDSIVDTRTVYVEPEARKQVPPYYLLLIMAGAQIAYELGGRYSMACTNTSNTDLMKLYSKIGENLGVRCDLDPESDLAVFQFDLDRIRQWNARIMMRLGNHLEVDPEILATIRSRSKASCEEQGRKCA